MGSLRASIIMRNERTIRYIKASLLLLSACSSATPEVIAEAGPTDATPLTDIATNHADTSLPQTDTHAPRDIGLSDLGVADAGATPSDAGVDATFGGQGSCVVAIQCAFQCNDDDTCIDDCLATALPRNREVTQRTMACARQNSCRDPGCLMSRCPDEARACGNAGGDAPTPPSGDTGMPTGDSYSCADMIRCVNACGADTSCFNGCLERIRPESSRLAADLTRCMMGARCLNMTCGQQACPDLYQQCIDDD